MTTGHIATLERFTALIPGLAAAAGHSPLGARNGERNCVRAMSCQRASIGRSKRLVRWFESADLRHDRKGEGRALARRAGYPNIASKHVYNLFANG